MRLLTTNEAVFGVTSRCFCFHKMTVAQMVAQALFGVTRIRISRYQ
jgi:hypothetical protein